MSENDSIAGDSPSATAYLLLLAFVAGVIAGVAGCWLFLHIRAIRTTGPVHPEPAALVFDPQRGDTVAGSPTPALRTVDTLRPVLPLDRAPANSPAPAPQTTDTSEAIDGIAAGATLGLLPVTSEEQSDENSVKHFILHIPIKARPKTRINAKDLVLHILFYDLINGQTVVQTSANVNFRWLTPPADWADRDTEELTVEYQLPKPEAKAAQREDRKYFGYIVRVYYQERLQAATAEPDRLRKQYPPPPTLPK